MAAAAFWAGDWLLEHFTAGQDPVVGATVPGPSLVLGATLDGIPESVAIGLTLLGGSSVSTAVVVAILAMLANTMMPEAFANGGREVGLVTVTGFILASALATIG